MVKRKICVFLGSRANYSSLKPIMREIKKDPEMELILFAGASALLDKYGEAAKLVESDGFKINEYVYMLVEGEIPCTMAKSVGLGLLEIPGLLRKHRPDFTLIVGDRFEMLSAAIASAFMNIPVAHTMGGEISGTIDESIRHAITKFAHLHFTANEQAKQNVIKMGENPEMVFNFGCPRIDIVKEIIQNNYDNEANEIIKTNGVGDIFDIKNKKFLLVSQYPVTTEFGSGEKQITETLFALSEIEKELHLPVIMLWPNADAGSDEISMGIRKFREESKLLNFHLFKNLPLHIFVHLMNKTNCMVGNSSAGIREGAFIGTPVVNIGTREKDRQRGENVINADYNKEDIKKAILKQIEHGEYASNPLYGDGNASKKIKETLKTARVDIQKKLYH